MCLKLCSLMLIKINQNATTTDLMCSKIKNKVKMFVNAFITV